MATVIISGQVRDFNQWKKVFEAAYEMRTANGELSANIYQDQNDPNKVITIREWDSLQKAQRYTQSPEFRQAMQEAGAIGEPHFQFLNQL